MAARPRIKLNLEPIDKLLDVGGILLLLVLWALVMFNYTNSPDTIATHFNSSGEADAYGEKFMLFIAPVVASVIFFLLFFINKVPHVFNYPVIITEDNAPEYYRLATRTIRLINICILLTFFAVNYTMINGGSSPLVIIIAVSLPILPVIWSAIELAKLKNK